MDADIASLVREERLLDGAALASQRGDHDTARKLYERACSFGLAALEALAMGDFASALPLAAEGRDDAAAGRALEGLRERGPGGERVALQLEQRGHALWAARLFEAVGKERDAARAYEKGGDCLKAAKLLEASHDVVAAARVLEGAMRRDPQRWTLHVGYGALLLRYGKPEHAARALQKVPAGAEERRSALVLLCKALGELGLAQAQAEASHELSLLGGPLAEAADDGPQVSVRARIFGRYEVLREVASSPSARVVECMDTVRSEHVAVKIFAGYDARGAGRDALARFEREVRVLGALDHPNVLPLRDYLPEGPALVLAWMRGGTLEDMLAKEPIAPARAVEIASAVLSALGEAHRMGVLHRDVKPANVLFDDAGVTRLGDFGAAHLGDLSATATAGLIGTLGYMSPEQREGRPATVQSDLYGVGAILWEMLTGERPSATEELRTRPSGMHRDLDVRHDSAVLRLLAESPEDRPPDAFAARRELTALRWPSTIERTSLRKRSEFPSPLTPGSGRVVLRADGVLVDSWLDRAIDCLPLEEHVLERARSFARVDHPALQPVLRVDREGGSLWLAHLPPTPLPRPLSPGEAALLRGALEALHAEGTVHGHVDADHVRVLPDGSPVLCFTATQGPTATVDTDRLGIARLAGE